MYLKFNTVTLWQDNMPYAELVSETDLNGRVNTIEELGDRTLNIYRDTKADNRTYTVVIKFGMTPRLSIQQIMTWWEETHSQYNGECVIERQPESGKVLQLLAVAETPQWSDVTAFRATVTQIYTAANPLWRESTESSATESFLGTTPTTLAFNNEGSVPSWVRLDYEGPLDDPKVSYATDWEIEFDLNLVADDALAVSARTPATAEVNPAVGANYFAYGYRTNATSFRLAKLPVGAGVLDMVEGLDHTELVLNPGFETPGALPPTFQSWNDFAGAGTIIDEVVLFHSGAHAVRLTTGAGTIPNVYQAFAVTPGITYGYSFWTRGDGADEGQYRIYDVTNAADIVATTGTGISGAVYTQVTGEVVAPAGCVSMRIYCYGSTNLAAAIAYFDDWSVVSRGILTAYWYNQYESIA